MDLERSFADPPASRGFEIAVVIGDDHHPIPVFVIEMVGFAGDGSPTLWPIHGEHRRSNPVIGSAVAMEPLHGRHDLTQSLAAPVAGLKHSVVAKDRGEVVELPLIDEFGIALNERSELRLGAHAVSFAHGAAE